MEQTDKRLTTMETAMMHLQNDYESLNEVVLENARRLDSMAKLIQGLTDQLEAVNDPQPTRTAEDEKPPHY